MTLHAIRVVAEKPTGVAETEAQQLVEQAISDFNRELVSEELQIQSVDNDLLDRPPHFRGVYRFSIEYDKSRILGFVEQTLRDRNDITWFELRYHRCQHEEENGGSCDEQVIASVGDIPSAM